MRINTLNGYLRGIDVNYIIKSEWDNKRRLENGEKKSNFRKTYWIIGEINYNKNNLYQFYILCST